MSRKRLGTRRGLFFKPKSGGSTPLYLPLVGPFVNHAPVLVSSLSNVDVNGQTFVNSSYSSPYIAKTLHVIQATGGSLIGNNYNLWVWCDKVNGEDGSGIIGSAPSIQPEMTGQDGNLGTCPINGGNGGTGATGGGGGGAATTGTPQSGGVGDVDGIAPGANGLSDTGMPGTGGNSTGHSYIVGCPFTFPIGGSTSSGTPTGPWGAAGTGATVAGNCGINYAGAGGGAGGGLTVICCNEVINISIISQGGNSGTSQTNACCVPPIVGAEAGAGGVIAIFTKKWPGLSTGHFSVDPGGAEGGSATVGNYRIYEVDHAGTTVLAVHTNPLDSWNHL